MVCVCTHVGDHSADSQMDRNQYITSTHKKRVGVKYSRTSQNVLLQNNEGEKKINQRKLKAISRFVREQDNLNQRGRKGEREWMDDRESEEPSMIV